PEAPDPQYGQSNRNNPQNQSPPNARKGIGFGLFLVLAGAVLLAERFGWLPSGSDWFFPAILIAWGVGELYQRLTSP
ncbi:MAG: hypothetical protein WCC57_12115, partial [Paracoccaceae bacterium]